jgi:hypothetical protein
VIEFLTASANLPFTVALALMMLIALMEGVGTVLGVGFSTLLDTMLPNIDLDVEGPEVESGTGLTRFMGWLRIGKVPFLVLLVVFLTAFGLTGLTIQSFVHNIAGGLLPAWVAIVPATLIALPVVRLTAGAVARIFPRDETEAVSSKSFIGRVATITLGTARPHSPAEAKLRDAYGQIHYVMVVPDQEEELPAGTEVLLLRSHGSHFRVLRNTHKALVD